MFNGRNPSPKPRAVLVLALVLSLALCSSAFAITPPSQQGDANILAFLSEEEATGASPTTEAGGSIASASNSGSLSAAAQALVATRSAAEQPVAQRGLEFVEAVFSFDPERVAPYILPEIMDYVMAFGFSRTDVAEMLMVEVYSIVGLSADAAGYDRINIDFYYGGSDADCDVYFQQAWDFLVVEMELYNGVYYVYNVY